MSQRISERDLVIPALYCIRESPSQELTTTELQQCLRELLRPSGKDLEILEGRRDDKFSQKVRNLRSHKTLEQRGLCTYADGNWRLTDLGRDIAESNTPFLQYLLENGFDYQVISTTLDEITPEQVSDIPRVPDYFDENLVIIEGRRQRSSQQVYTRSVALREQAIKYYSQDGQIRCHACGFDFGRFYGAHGEGFIEIHHKQPIVAYTQADVEKTIKDALNNIVPLCSNCHRMIHRNRERMLTVDELIRLIEEQKTPNSD